MDQEMLYLLLGLGSALGTGLVTIATLYITRDKRGADTMAVMTDSVGKMVANLDTLISEREHNTRRITELESKFELQKIEHKQQIEVLEERHQEQVKLIEARHFAEMQKMRNELKLEHEQQIAGLRKELQAEHQIEMEQLKRHHQLEMDKLQQSHKTQMDELKKHHAAEIKRLNEQIISLETTLGDKFGKNNGDAEVSLSDSHPGAATNPMDSKDE